MVTKPQTAFLFPTADPEAERDVTEVPVPSCNADWICFQGQLYAAHPPEPAKVARTDKRAELDAVSPPEPARVAAPDQKTVAAGAASVTEDSKMKLVATVTTGILNAEAVRLPAPAREEESTKKANAELSSSPLLVIVA